LKDRKRERKGVENLNMKIRFHCWKQIKTLKIIGCEVVKLTYKSMILMNNIKMFFKTNLLPISAYQSTIQNSNS
jgi:hypothetical protein